MNATVVERHLIDDEIVSLMMRSLPSKCLTRRSKCGDKRKARSFQLSFAPVWIPARLM